MLEHYTNKELWNALEFYKLAPKNNLQAKQIREEIKEEIYSRGSHFAGLENDPKELEKFLNDPQFS